MAAPEGRDRAPGAGDPASRGRRPTWRLAGLGLATIAAAITAIYLAFGDTTPALDARGLEEARERWRRNGPADYELTLFTESDARAGERIESSVRGGTAVRILRDGRQVDARDAYTVPGLFGVMERELEMARAPSPAGGAPKDAVLKARFDERHGFPIVFKRIARNRLSLVITVESLRLPGGEALHGKE